MTASEYAMHCYLLLSLYINIQGIIVDEEFHNKWSLYENRTPIIDYCTVKIYLSKFN